MPELLAFTDAFADVGIIAAFVAALVFVLSYVGFHDWRKTPAGRSLVYFVVSLLAVALLSYLGRWIGPEYWGRELLRPVVWWSVAFTGARLTYVLWTTSEAGESISLGARKPKRSHKR